MFDTTRRRVLQSLGIGGTAAVAGCSAPAGESPATETVEENQASQPQREDVERVAADPADVPDTDDLADVGAAYVDPGGEFLVVESEGHIVAMGGLAVDGEDLADGEGELFRIGVDTDHQRRGYGSAILAGLEDAARERGLDRIVLTTARRQAAATEFYPAHGYERVGRERQGEYRLVRFAKSLE